MKALSYRMQPIRPALATVALALLTACSGDGGSNDAKPTSNVQVNAPSLSFSTQEYSYPYPASQTVHATYTQDAMVVGYPMSTSIPTWLTYSVTPGTGKSVDVMIQPNSSTTSTGVGGPTAPYDLHATLRFATGVGLVDESHYSSYVDLPITYHITPGLWINPVDQHVSCTHGSTPANAPYVLALQASVGFPWTVTTDQPWLVPSPSSGSGTSFSAKINMATTTLAAGSYVGTVSVQSTDGSVHRSIKIYLTVN